MFKTPEPLQYEANQNRRSRGPALLALLGAMFAFLIGAFCVFGFVASFEPGPFMTIRILYAAAGILCFLGGVWLLVWRVRISR